MNWKKTKKKKKTRKVRIPAAETDRVCMTNNDSDE